MTKTTMPMEQELEVLRRENAKLRGLVHKGLKGCLSLKDLPPYMLDDRHMILAALRAKLAVWYDLPAEWKDDPAIACAVFEYRKLPKY
jgi:hypothetical protein